MRRRKLPAVRGNRLQERLEVLRAEPVRSPDWRSIVPRAFLIGGFFVIAWLWPTAWQGAATYARDAVLILFGYLLHGNVVRLRDGRFWRDKPEVRNPDKVQRNRS